MQETVEIVSSCSAVFPAETCISNIYPQTPQQEDESRPTRVSKSRVLGQLFCKEMLTFLGESPWQNSN